MFYKGLRKRFSKKYSSAKGIISIFDIIIVSSRQLDKVISASFFDYEVLLTCSGKKHYRHEPKLLGVARARDMERFLKEAGVNKFHPASVATGEWEIKALEEVRDSNVYLVRPGRGVLTHVKGRKVPSRVVSIINTYPAAPETEGLGFAQEAETLMVRDRAYKEQVARTLSAVGFSESEVSINTLLKCPKCSLDLCLKQPYSDGLTDVLNLVTDTFPPVAGYAVNPQDLAGRGYVTRLSSFPESNVTRVTKVWELPAKALNMRPSSS